jgi:hypothetical protein
MSNKRKIGMVSLVGFFLIGLIDHFSLAISSAIGKLYCGDSYMQAVNGVTGDVSCGFNMDMYLIAFVVVGLIISLIVTVRAN